MTSTPRILVIDDSPSTLEVLAGHFREAGYHVAAAASGPAGLREAEADLPDLILLDVAMPGQDGIATCRQLKASPLLHEVPVIFMTGDDSEGLRLDAFAIGAVDYVTKPLQLVEVQARVRTHIAMHAMQKRLTRQNLSLQLEMAARQRSEANLREQHERLELLIAQRTSDLAQRSQALEASLAQLHAAQKQLVKSETMASLGRLVAGLSHEISTPVGMALTASGLLADKFDAFHARVAEGQIKRSDMDNFLEQGVELARATVVNCKRAAELVGRLKSGAADRSSEQRRSFDLLDYVRETMASMGPHLKSHGISADIAGDAGIVMDSYPGVLAQVLANLATNAQDHAFDGHGGHLLVNVSRAPDGQAVLDFADNGQGMRPEDLDRVFDPFFTTRREAGNSGLGMHIIETLVTATLGGTVDIASKRGEGTTVTLTLPTTAPA